MRRKVSDYIADFLAGHGVHQVFSVVGGGAMHLNDSLGHHAQISCIYNHHEQASAMAATCMAISRATWWSTGSLKATIDASLLPGWM